MVLARTARGGGGGGSLGDSFWPGARGDVGPLWRAVARPHVALASAGGVAVAAGTLLWVCLRTNNDLDDLHQLKLAQDPIITRLWEHCAAPADGDEGTSPKEDAWKLHSIVVLTNHGDISAIATWPGETQSSAASALFDCRPKVLPRYWRLNQRVSFQVVDANGARQDQSFTPDFLEEGTGGRHYLCAAGQLTGVGFRQMVSMGRHLSNAYASFLTELVGSGDLARHVYVRSAITKRALASAVGLMMSLLASPEAVEAFGDGSELGIHASPARGSSSASAQQEASVGDQGDLGEHLLARWCHQLPWPCGGTGVGALVGEGTGCVSIEQGAKLVAEGEAASCGIVASESEAAQLLADWRELLLREEPPSLAVVSAEGAVLSAAVTALLGHRACADPLVARPPFASRLVVERWRPKSFSGSPRFLVRVLWNGRDVTERIPGCDGGGLSELVPGQGGCDASVLGALLAASIRA